MVNDEEEDETYEEDLCLSEEVVTNKLIIVQQILIENERLTLKKLVAIAYFKKVATAYCYDINASIKGAEEIYEPYLQIELTKFFNLESEADLNKLIPYNIFIMKLLYSKVDVLKTYFVLLRNRAPWVLKLDINDTDVSDH